jgi:hypothetical protein
MFEPYWETRPGSRAPNMALVDWDYGDRHMRLIVLGPQAYGEPTMYENKHGQALMLRLAEGGAVIEVADIGSYAAGEMGLGDPSNWPLAMRNARTLTWDHEATFFKEVLARSYDAVVDTEETT